MEPKVGHNIYILCHQLSVHNKDLAAILKPTPNAPSIIDPKNQAALTYYAKHTAQIEVVRMDRTLEQIVFPIPEICEYLTEETKRKVLHTTEVDEQGSKVADFFDKTPQIFHEMKWQKSLRGQKALFWVSSYMSIWSTTLFYLAVLTNLLVALFYPFGDFTRPDTLLVLLLWIITIALGLSIYWIPKFVVILTFGVSFTIMLLLSWGPHPTLLIIGIILLILKFVHLCSIVGNRGTLSKTIDKIIRDRELYYHVAYLMFCFLGVLAHPFFYSVLLFDVIYREETLLNVIRSVTRNGRSIILTAVLALILVYMFSIVGFIVFRDDFLMEVDEYDGSEDTGVTPINFEPPISMDHPDCVDNPAAKYLKDDILHYCTKPERTEFNQTSSNQTNSSALDETGRKPIMVNVGGEMKEKVCETLLMCIMTTLNQGLRNGGGIGDVLRAPSSTESLYVPRVVYDLLFFFIVIIIVLNLIFGVIIDTFADLRSEKQQKESLLKSSCFICGLNRSSFDNKSVSFEEHTFNEHNMWHYLFFIVLVKVKDPTEFTGPESYVFSMVKENNLDWFPRLRAKSLATNEGESSTEVEYKTLQTQLESTKTMLTTLTNLLTDLKDQMTEQRKQKQRIGLLNSTSSYMQYYNQHHHSSNHINSNASDSNLN